MKKKFITPSIAALTVIEETLIQKKKNAVSSFDPTIYCERNMEDKGNDLLVPEDKRIELQKLFE